jgi:hypothetical protein
VKFFIEKQHEEEIKSSQEMAESSSEIKDTTYQNVRKILCQNVIAMVATSTVSSTYIYLH